MEKYIPFSPVMIYSCCEHVLISLTPILEKDYFTQLTANKSVKKYFRNFEFEHLIIFSYFEILFLCYVVVPKIVCLFTFVLRHVTYVTFYK